MAGANSPFTLAGTLIQTNAEALGSLVMLQTLCPGIPTWYYVIMEAMDMQKGSLQLFTPEIMLLYSGVMQMARYYNLPAAAPSGISPNTQIHQILFERGISLMMNSLSGICEIGGIGAIKNGMMISPELLIIDSEMMAFVKRYLTGFEISSDTLAIEAIHRQCNNGNFLEDSHTFEHLRREVRFRPMLFDWQQEINSSEKEETIFRRAADTLRQLIQDHIVPPLDYEKLKEIEAVMTSARKCLE
jgi:trimethylamine--corrinoid protein Co-methyltransferase